MRGTDVVGIIGGGLLVAGFVFGIADPRLFDHWYDWVFGPFFWMMGCTLIIAWVFGRFNQSSEPTRVKQRRAGADLIADAEAAQESAQSSERRHEERRHEERRKSASAA